VAHLEPARWKRRIDENEAHRQQRGILLYQTLLGTWPFEPFGELDAKARGEYVARIQQYMAKALKEAKLNTSWVQPNEAWDGAMAHFIAKILELSPRNRFLESFVSVAEKVARVGAINSLSTGPAQAHGARGPGCLSRKRDLGFSVWSIRIIGGRLIT
jgi:(1->4)-alpha-D-glucan 1-alpha-D-glucosylmutase